MDENTFYIQTKLDNSGLEKGSRELAAKIQDLVKKASELGTKSAQSAEKMGASLLKQNKAIDEQKKKIAALKEELEGLDIERQETAEYKAVLKQLEQVEKKYNSLVDAKERYLATGGKSKNTLRKYDFDIEERGKELASLKAEKQYMLDKGTAFTGKDTSKQVAQLEKEMRKLDDMEQKLGVDYDAFQTKVQAPTALDKTKQGFEDLGKTLKQNAKHTATQVKHILLMGIGVRSLFALARRIRTYLIDGVNNMAQIDKGLNEALSNTKSLATQLKNSIATAAAPVIKALLPAIDRIIEKMIDASNSVANFFAVLNGDETYTKAIKANEDYAASVKTAAGALASFDKVNVIGGSGKASVYKMFDTETATTELNDRALKWKGIFEDVKKTFDTLLNPGSLTDEQATGWESVGGTIGTLLVGGLDITSKIIDGIDTKKIGESISKGLKNIDYGTIGKGTVDVITSLKAAGNDFITGMFAGFTGMDADSEITKAIARWLGVAVLTTTAGAKMGGLSGGIAGLVLSIPISILLNWDDIITSWSNNKIVSGINKGLEKSADLIFGDLEPAKEGTVGGWLSDVFKGIKDYKMSMPWMASGSVTPPTYQSSIASQRSMAGASTVINPQIQSRIVLELDGETIYEKMVDLNDRNTMRTGNNAFAP